MEDWYLNPEPPSAPVTSLLDLGDVLLSGEGSFLHLYRMADSRKYFIKVFTSSNIHGIVKNSLSMEAYQICVFGGRFCRIITLDLSFKLVEVSLEKQVAYWISDCCWVLYNGSHAGIVLYLSNNTLSLYDANSLRMIGTVGCQELCILYSAKILFEPSWDGVVALGGTVFNQIIVWSTSTKSFFQQSHIQEPVLHKLTGHKGVILGLDWSPTRRELCSVSDDRSIRVQKMVLSSEDISFEDWSKCEFHQRLVLYGHTARVWRAKMLENMIISIAEDATCAVWNYDGRMIQKFIGHRGKNICSLEVNQIRKEIYTGGSDGSIRVWSFQISPDVMTPIQTPDLKAPFIIDPPVKEEKDFPRTIRLIDNSRLLVMMDKGCLLMLDIASNSWIYLMVNDKYSSYCLVEVFDNVVAVANIHGWILFLQIDGVSSTILLEEQVHDGKVLSFHWLSSKEFLTTGPHGDVIAWQVKPYDSFGGLHVISKYLLPIASQRWISAAAVDMNSNSLVCGDRIGSIHIYKYPSSNEESPVPVKSFSKILGSFGVTCVCKHGDQVYCCGRNGQIYIFKGASAETFNIIHVFNAYKGFDWLSRILFTDSGQYIVGFLSDRFVMFDLCANRFLLGFSCGGGHRAWDFEFNKSQYNLAFIKKRQIVMHRGTLETQKSLIKPSHQGLGINSILHLGSTFHTNGFVDMFVTAGEDGLMNFTSASSSISNGEVSYLREDFSNIRVISTKGHTTGLKTVMTIEMEEKVTNEFKNLMMFTAGAGGVIKAWSLQILKEFTQFDGVSVAKNIVAEDTTEEKQTKICNSQQGVLLKHLCGHVLNTKYHRGCKPWRHFEVNEMLEARYMSLDALLLPKPFHAPEDLVLVFAGCSLGFVRAFAYNVLANRFELLKEFDFHEHCVLRVKHFLDKKPSSTEECVWLMSAATDGRLAFWNLNNDIKNFLKETSQSQQTSMSEPSFTLQCHQSGIDALDFVLIDGARSLLMCTGGDDNSIAIMQLNVPLGLVNGQNKHPSAHASKVSGVKFLSEKCLLSVSIDQRLILWKVEECFELVMVRSIMLDISDISDMLVIKYSGNKINPAETYGVLVAGRGIQRVHLSARR